MCSVSKEKDGRRLNLQEVVTFAQTLESPETINNVDHHRALFCTPGSLLVFGCLFIALRPSKSKYPRFHQPPKSPKPGV